MKTRALVVSTLLALEPAAAVAQTATSSDARVQAPELAAPQRGSVAGQLASLVFGPGDVSRGAFTLPAPFAVPSERGALLAAIFPAYAPEAPLGEWGLGWTTSLAVTRARLAGDLDYATDDLAGPWGRMIAGADGAFYPVGLAPPVRLEATGDTLTAHTPDGTRYTFGGAARTTNLSGTYAWYLTDVETPTGRGTHLTWAANASGRLFLEGVSYGGAGTDFQYRVELAYDRLPSPLVDHRSRYPLELDRRVKTVTVRARNVASGAFEERWRYELAYLAEGLGPAFFLESVQQRFPLGDAPPPTRYTYRRGQEQLAATALVPVPQLGPVLSTLGSDALLPARSARLDAELDGLQDLEHNTDNRLVRQTATGFVFEALPPAPAGAPLRCRRPPNEANPPRLLAQLDGDDTWDVVDLLVDPSRLGTALTVCDRAGNRLGGQSLAGDWQPASNVRLVDLNRDHRPDLVRVSTGSYRVLPNVSADGTFAFGDRRSGTLSPAVTPDTTWVHDVNGDSVPDLVVRTAAGSALFVWYGRGDFEFVPQAQVFRLWRGTTQVASLSGLAFVFADANKDGLADLVATSVQTNASTLFVNRGAQFDEVVVPALRAVDPFSARPLVGDFAGSGNTELVFTRGALADAVALDGPAVGLLATADDGKGTVVRFEYGRAPAGPGARHRPSVVTRVEVRSSGYDAATSDYAYETPTVHTVGKFLVGFDRVTRVTPTLTHVADFMNEDRYAGVLVRARRHDSNAPAVDAFEAREYVEAPPFRGLAWKRLKDEASGFVDASGATISDRTDYVTYVRDFCPETVTRSTAAGVLTVTKTYVPPAAFGPALSCVWTNAVEEGAHADPSLHFVHQTALTLNAVGLPEKVESVADTGRWTLQTIGYRPDWLVDRLETPGRGATSFAYDPGTLLLRSVTTPDGVVVEVRSRDEVAEPFARDPLRDGILTLRTTRGTAIHHQFFRYDGQERLARGWDDLGATTDLNPAARFDYELATASEPAAIRTRLLVGGALASARESVDLVTAAGEPIVTASRIPGGWTFGGIVTRSRSTAEARTSLRPTLAEPGDPTALDHAALLAGASQVGSEVSSLFGHASLARTTYHPGVERQVSSELTLSGGLLRLSSVENGAHATTTWMDASRHVVAFDDEASVRTGYAYDALGRLREVTLPDGARHRVRYDAHGRPWRIEREGLPGAAQVAVEQLFEPVTGLTTERRFLSTRTPGSTEALVRTVGFTYDGIGRVALETHTDAATGATKTFRFFYDGATPAQPTLRTTLGVRTGVSGDGFTKTFAHRADGLLSRRVVLLTGWRSVETTLGYLESGVVGARTVKVYDAAGAQLSASARTYLHDAQGRLRTIELDGVALTTFTYGVNGELRTATFPGSNDLTLEYDDLTRRPTGSAQHTPGYDAGAMQVMNARGLVDVETLIAGVTRVSRGYGYSAQRFLADSSDGLATYVYGFDPFGLPASIETNHVVKTIARSATTLTAGDVVYRFDALGRAVARGDLTLVYGPDGQVATATREASTWSFVHDDAGQRLLKSAGGVPVAAFLEEGTLDAGGLSERMQVAGRTVGFLRNGAFTSVATDARGTVLAETSGTARLASPFGWRGVHPSMSAALDYADKGFDADLGVVRMGVRDYDPEIDQFLSPDPLFLAEPERSLDSPVEANLYAYALNVPNQFTDPSGRCYADVNRGLDCNGYARDLSNQAWGNMVQNWKEGNVGWAAGAALLWVASGPTRLVGLAEQALIEPGNASYLATRGVQERDAGMVAEGTVRLTFSFATAWAAGGGGAAAESGGASFGTRFARFFWDKRSYPTVSREYWAEAGPAAGRSLHHWLFPQRWKWVPDGFRNAGFNLVEMPAWNPFHPTLPLNQWMGFAPWWHRPLTTALAGGTEWAIRIGIPALMGGSAYGGYELGTRLHLDFLGDGGDGK